MASPQAAVKLSSELQVVMYDFDENATTAVAGTLIAARDLKSFMGLGMTSVLSGSGMTLLEIVVATSSTGAGIAQLVTSGTQVANAVGDYVMVECTDEMIAQEAADAGANYTHVGLRVTNQGAADENVLTYIMESKRPVRGLTATTIST